MSIPILIVLPFWEGDKTQAIEICKIVAGLQGSHAGQTAHIMLAHRQDCKLDPNMIKIVAPKFNVITYQCTSPLKGWPQGPNGMFGSTMINIANNRNLNYECIYWLEPDAVPIRPNWFWDLVLEWRRRHPSANIVGCRADCDGNGKGDHITGCALYHPNIARILPCITTSSHIAWDYHHRAKIIAMSGSTRLIQNWYKAIKAHEGILDQNGVVIIHGHKDLSMINHVKRRFKISP